MNFLRKGSIVYFYESESQGYVPALVIKVHPITEQEKENGKKQPDLALAVFVTEMHSACYEVRRAEHHVPKLAKIQPTAKPGEPEPKPVYLHKKLTWLYPEQEPGFHDVQDRFGEDDDDFDIPEDDEVTDEKAKAKQSRSKKKDETDKSSEEKTSS